MTIRPPAGVNGLTTEEARRILARDGPNEPLQVAGFAPLREFLHLTTSPLIVMLLVASVISALVGEIVNATVIAAMVLMGIVLSWWQSVRAHRATERLRLLVSLTARVERDGEWKDVPQREVVAGDLIRLVAGLVPADARLVESRDLHVLEAALTGESVPSEKGTPATPLAAPPSEHTDLVYLGTSVTSGTGTAMVLATGSKTEFGRIAASLARPAPATEFERGSRAFGYFINDALPRGTPRYQRRGCRVPSIERTRRRDRGRSSPGRHPPHQRAARNGAHPLGAHPRRRPDDADRGRCHGLTAGRARHGARTSRRKPVASGGVGRSTRRGALPELGRRIPAHA